MVFLNLHSFTNAGFFMPIYGFPESCASKWHEENKHTTGKSCNHTYGCLIDIYHHGDIQ